MAVDPNNAAVANASNTAAQDAAKKFSEEYEKQLLDALKGSHEQYDKAILTLSSGGLALSITLLKDLFPVDKVILSWLLATSWYLFGTAIISTIFSFLTSIKSVNTQRDNFHKYYILQKREYLDKKNWWTIGTIWLNRISAMCFVLGVIATIIFAHCNFKEKLKIPLAKTSTDTISAIQKPMSSAVRPPLAKKKKKVSPSINSTYRVTINGSGNITMDIPPKAAQKNEGADAIQAETLKSGNSTCP